MDAERVMLLCLAIVYLVSQLVVLEGLYKQKIPFPWWPAGVIALLVAPLTIMLIIACGGYVMFSEDGDE